MNTEQVLPTQGEWVLREQGEANEWCVITVDDKWVISFRQNGELMPATQLANARLMVAAPKLHDALQLLIVEVALAEKLWSGDPAMQHAIQKTREAFHAAKHGSGP